MNSSNQNIIELINPVLNELSLELVDLELRGNDRKRILRIFVYQPGGVTLDMCVTASRQIAGILDRVDAIPGKYVLEVSSPGLDRPLKTSRDFERNLGEKVKIVLQTDNIEKISRIGAVDGELITMQDGEESWDFNIKDLGSAKIIVEF